MIRLLPLLALLASGAPAQDGTVAAGEPDAERTAAQSEGGAREAGLKIVRDPVSGRIIDQPTPEQLARLSEGVELEARRSPQDLRRFGLAGGGEGVFLDGWADHSLTVKRDADGRLGVVCPQGADDAAPAGNDEAGSR